ncbi:MAG: FtsQ-type POTRA domain-containing protein [Bacilli bacterium]|nr:FtsQ-type POTRA domain-containing protein [Bacilli bacterium]
MKRKNRPKKKHKLNFFKLLLVLLILYLFGFAIYLVVKMPIKNIYILKTNILSNDQELLKLAKIDNYPSFFFTSSSSIKKRLLKNEYIKSVKVEKKWLGAIYITINEHEVLYYDQTNNFFVLDNKERVTPINTLNNIPILINYIPDTIYDEFVEKMVLIDDNIKQKISSIEYKPTDLDKERFLLILNDGNYVYLTLYKFETINKYDQILITLENKKGILYLDSGNYFEIFK